MKVFLSWSGELSKNVALIIREWLPSVIQSIQPYVSSEDIDKGTRWSSDIAGELDISSYGVIIVTKENIKAPWINFEAGALSKHIDKSNVSPFLFNLKRSEVAGPLLQFQSTIYTKEEMLKLIESINKAQTDPLEKSRIEKVFNVWWPSLKDSLDSLLQTQQGVEEVDPTKEKEQSELNSEILEELLELARNQQKILRSPEEILPPEYLREVIRRSRYSNRSREFFREIHNSVFEIRDLSYNIKGSENKKTLDEIENILLKIHDICRFANEGFSTNTKRKMLEVSEREKLFNLDN